MPLTGAIAEPRCFRTVPIFSVTPTPSANISTCSVQRRPWRPAPCACITEPAERQIPNLFQVVVALCFQPAAVAPMMAALGPEMAEKFAADRAELSGGRGSIASLAPSAAEAALQATLVPLEGQLVHSPFLLGDAPTIADFSVYHCLWLLARNPWYRPFWPPLRRWGFDGSVGGLRPWPLGTAICR